MKPIIMPNGKMRTYGVRPKKVLMGMPIGRPMDLIPLKAWVDLTLHAVNDSRFLILQKYTKTAYLDLNRDRLAQYALDKDCDYVLMIDSDMSYPSDLLARLYSRDKDVIGVPYYTGRNTKKGERIQPIIFDYNGKSKSWAEWEKVKQKEPFRVEAVGTGIMLIKTEVFKKFERPWFAFFYHPQNPDTRRMGEDLGFCMKCLAKGIEIWVDPTFGDSIKHWKLYGYSEKDCSEK